MQGFYARFLESVERWPENIAVEMQREASLDRHSYAELRRMAESVGRWLTESGVARGSRCVVLAQNRPRWVAAYLGAVAAGMVAVPFDTAFKAAQIGRLLRDCGASVVFTDRKNLETARRATEGLTVKMVLLDPAPDETSDLASLDTILAAGPGNFRPAEPKLEDLAVILYTSGTTAEPQGVMLTQDNLLGEIESVFIYLDIRPTDVILGVLPLFHALAQMANLMLPLSGGASVVYLETLNTAELLRALRERQVTIFVCVPQFFYLIHERVLKQVKEGGAATQTAFRFLMALSRLGRRLGWNLGKVFFRKAHEALGTSMRYLITGGSRFDPAIGHDLDALGFDILQAYGLTETSGGAFATPPLHNVIGSVGPPLPGVEVKIVDALPPEDGEGPALGEVVIRGRIVMQGYYNRPDLTALALRDGWLYSGDLGYFDSGGNLFITGRRKEVIVLSSGKNISPEEVEQHYLKCQWVKEMCVMGLQSRPGEPFSERLHGVVVPNFELLKQKHIVNTREVIRWEFEGLSQQLPSTKRILSFELWQEELPRTTTRKLKRYEIQKKVEAKRAAGGGEAAPEARAVSADDAAWLELPDVQRALKVVRRAVKPPPASLHPADNLELDLALDSMERVELLVALEHELGAAVDESVVSGVYTVREMVDAVRAGVDAVGSGVGAAGGPRGFAGWDAVFAAEPTDPELLAIDEPHPLRTRAWFLLGKMVDMFARDRFQFRITGLEKLPPHGPFILCPNHQSYLDPILLASALPYSLFRDHFSVGTSEIFGQGTMNWVARSLKIVVVDPDANLVPAMRAGAYGLRRGKMLLLFPEGERTIDGPPKVFKKGAAILSIHMKVPIYPVALDGFFDAWPRGRSFQGFLPLRMAIGDPIYPPPLGKDPEATYDALTRELKARLMEMWTPMHAELHGDTLEPGQLAAVAD